MSSRPPEDMTATEFRIFSSAAGAGDMLLCMQLCIKLPEELGQYRKNDQPVAFKTALRQFTHEELLDLLVDAAFGKS